MSSEHNSPAQAADEKEPTSKPEVVKYAIGEETFSFRPKVALDDFYRFTHERLAILTKRARGDPQPWSTDEYLTTYPYCNVFRVHDAGCQFFIQNVVQTGSQEDEEVLFRVLLWNRFIRIGTWELLVKEFGQLTFKDFDDTKYVSVLRQARENGIPLHTAAYQKFPPFGKRTDAEVGHMALLAGMMEGGFLERIQAAKSAADVFNEIRSWPSMGEFNALQLYLDLSYTSLINFHPNDLVALGPGSKAGLRLCFTAPAGMEGAIIRWMTATQDEHFKRLGLEFAGLGPDNAPMLITDVEHTLCEFAKYVRHKNGGQIGTYKPSANKPTEVLPDVWSSPKRLAVQPNIIVEPSVDVEKRYIIEKIVGVLTAASEDGGEPVPTHYRVRWLGWAANEDTWEPAETLKNDAADEIDAFNNRVDDGEEEPSIELPGAEKKPRPRPRKVQPRAPERSSPRKGVTSTYASRKRKRVVSSSKAEAPVAKRGRGRPPKSDPGRPVKRGPGRPPKRGPGRPAKRRRVDAPAPVEEDEEEEEEEEERYVVDAIVDEEYRASGRKKALFYRIHWKGYGVRDRTWEPASNVKVDAPAAVKDWTASQRAEVKSVSVASRGRRKARR